jgi:MYXO-CTERM domain-containing protein
VFPVAGTTLPANGRLLNSGADRVLVTHADASVEDLAVDEPFVSAQSGAFGTVTPTLIDGDAITVEKVCSEPCGTPVPQAWPVGPADEAPPAIADLTASAEYQYDYAFLVEPTLTVSEVASVHFFGDEIDDVRFPPDWQSALRIDEMQDGRWVPLFFNGTDDRTVCFDAIATDLAGNESAAASTCVDLVADRNPLQQFLHGCASTSSASTALFALTALLLRRRRRR